jgi:hypothetical protein
MNRDSEVRAWFLLQVSSSGQSAERFRFVLGDCELKFNVSGTQIFEAFELQGFLFTLYINTKDVQIRGQTFTSKWFDIEELVMSEKIVVTKNVGGTMLVVSADFLNMLNKLQKKSPGLGASFRWALLATPGGHIILVIHGFPEKAEVLRMDYHMSTDTAPTILLFSSPVKMEMNKSGLAPGPMPKLFALHPACAKENLIRNASILIPG